MKVDQNVFVIIKKDEDINPLVKFVNNNAK